MNKPHLYPLSGEFNISSTNCAGKRSWIAARAGIVWLGLLLSTGEGFAEIVATDAYAISGFELFRNGLYWSGAQPCSQDGKQGSDIGLIGYVSSTAPISTSPIQQVFAFCNAAIPNVTRDDGYFYFADNEQGHIYKKAVNLSPTDPATDIQTPWIPLPAPATLGPVTVWNGILYWTESLYNRFYIYSLNATDGSNPRYLGSGDGTVTKMVGSQYQTGVASFGNALFLLATEHLVRFGLDPENFGPVQLATGVSDFALRNESAGDINHFFHFTTVYAAIGHWDPAAAPTAPGKLLTINADTGATTTIYNSADYNTMNQLFSVTVDRQDVFFTEAPIICSGAPPSFGCDLGPYHIQRQLRPPDGSAPGDWETIAGVTDQGQDPGGDNLRSDGKWWLYCRQGKQISRISRNVAGVRFAFDLYADRIEVVQTTQNLLNEVRLVTKKPTFARGYAYVAVNNTGATPFFPQASLRGWLDGQELLADPTPYAINNAMVDDASDLVARRGNDPLSKTNRSFLFQLPDSWVENSGNLVVQMTVNPNHLLHETGPLPNTISSPSMQLIKMGSPCLVTVGIDVTTGPVYWPQDNRDGFNAIIDRARKLLPVEDFQVHFFNDVIRKPVFYVLPYPDIVYRSFSLPDEKDSAMTWLSVYQSFESDPSGCGDTHWVGTVSPTASGFGGLGRTPVPVPNFIPGARSSEVLVNMEPGTSGACAPSVWGSPRGGEILAHELTHNYGENHIYNPPSCGCSGSPDGPYDDTSFDFSCTIGSTDLDDPGALVGFDPITESVIIPTATGPGDLMTYVAQRWMSKYTIDFLFGHIPGLSFGKAAQAQQSFSAQPQSPTPAVVLLIHGMLNPTTGLAELLPCYQLPSGTFDVGKIAASMAVAAAQSNSTYFVRLVSSDGSKLLETPLVLQTTDEGASFAFAQFVSSQPDTHRIQLVTSNNVLLADRLVSPNAPTLAVGAPVLNAAAQTLDLSWTASDADGDALLFTIQYSPDTGTTWHTLKVGYPFLAARFDTRMLPGGAMAQLRVIATDGFNSTVAVTAPFSLARHAPEMVIGGVSEGQHLPFGGMGTLTGMAFDAEQGSLPGSSLVWNLAGPSPRQKTGGSFPLLDLSPGVYSVSLTATDADNMTGSVTQRFQILSLVVPDQDLTPVLDGVCGDPAYGEAAFVRFPLGNGQFAPVRLVHSAGNLYVSFSDLSYAFFDAPPSVAGLQIHSAPGDSDLFQPGDVGFYVDENGNPSNFGPGAFGARIAIPPPTGFAVVISRGESSWSAEMQIPDSLVGGWDHAVGLMFSQNTANWPPLAGPASPLTWASAYFGTPSVPTAASSLPAANAGPNRTYIVAQPETIFLDGSASFDPDGFPLTYAWTQIAGPTVSLASSTTAMPSFVATSNSAALVLGFQLVVSNGANDSLPAYVQVTLKPAPKQTLTVHPPIIVTSTSDSGDGSLRLAVLDAAPGQVITFAPGLSGTITLLSEMIIAKNVTISGPDGACGSLLTISGNNTNRVFHITGGTIQMTNLRIGNGHVSGGGGGILVDGGSLSMSNCTIADCYSFTTGGGGIYVGPATLALVGCTVSGNGTAFYGGGLMLHSGALVSLLNTTVSGNGTFDGSNDDAWGGGIFVYGSTVNILNSTIANNSSVTAGGGIYRYSGTVTVGNSLIARNISPVGPDCKDGVGLNGQFVSSGYNLIGNTSGSTGFGSTGDQLNLDPMIGPLADNGGPTLTHALLAGSPAIDSGTSLGIPTDQRGRPRPYDFASVANASGGDGSDIGAFEADTLAGQVLQYGVVDLGTLGGDGVVGHPGSWASAINNSGQIVGYSYNAGNATYSAAFWTNSSSLPLGLATFGGDDGEALGINDLGQIVGAADSSGNTSFKAAVWTSITSVPTELSGIGGSETVAYSINRSAQIVGVAYDTVVPVRGWHAVYWASPSSGPVRLGDLGGTNKSDAYWINDAGQIVGDTSPDPDPTAGFHATYWASGGSAPLDMGTLGKPETYCYAINNAGQIVGGGLTSPAGAHFLPFFWTNSSSRGVILNASGHSDSEAWGINATGQIVGWAGDSKDVYSGAAIWPNISSPAIDLNTLIPANSGWNLWLATAINDLGEIVGLGTINGHDRAFALLPLGPALRITSVAIFGNDLQLSFPSETCHTYSVLSSSDLVAGPWGPVRSGISGNGGTVQVTIPLPPSSDQPRQFFRIQREQ